MVAMRTLKVLYPYAVGIGCFSHTLDRVGEKFNVPTLYDFMTYWISLFSHSPIDTQPLAGGANGKSLIKHLNYLGIFH